MDTKRIEIWVWVLIYGGMVVFGVGLAVQRGDASLGWPFVVAGAVLVAIGVLLIWIRSRIKTDNTRNRKAAP